MNREVELKLALDSNQLDRLRRHPLVRSLARRRAKTQDLDSTYFDTPEHSLREQGMALRVRRIGPRRVQTLKILRNGCVSSLQHHVEFEAELGGETPDLSLISDEALRQSFAEQGLQERLTPVFTTTISRRSIALQLDDSEVELALDSGEIVSGDTHLPVSEAEFELVSGKPARLYELALALSDKIPFVLERRTKAGRGYDIHADPELSPVKATRVELSPEMTAAEVFVLTARACLSQICANEPVVLGTMDPEGVHQMRVGVRRFRALVSAFRAFLAPEALEFLKEELRWLQQALGPAREWDVFIDETLGPIEARMPEASGLALMRKAALAARDEAYEAARAQLRERRYTEFLLRTDLLLEDGSWALPGVVHRNGLPPRLIGEVAREILDRNDRKLRKLSKKHHELSDAELHRIRILGKKMRYSAEFFGSLYPKRALARQLSVLKRIQDALGSLNDAVTGRRQLEELEHRAAQIGVMKGAEMALAAATVRGWQAAQIERDLADFKEAWPHYREARRYWRV